MRRFGTRNLGTTCTSPNYTRLNSYKSDYANKLTILARAKQVLSSVQSNTDRGGLTPRTIKHWLDKYNWWVSSAPVNAGALTNFKNFKIVYASVLKTFITQISLQVTGIQDKITQETRIIEEVKKAYEICIRVPVIIQDIYIADKIDPDTSITTVPTAQPMATDKNKMLLYIGLAGAGVYLLTRKKKKKR